MRSRLGVLAIIVFVLVFFALILYGASGVVATEDFRAYFGIDLLGRWSLSDDEKTVLKPSVEKRLTELKENYLAAVNEREEWAEKPHPDKTIAEALDILKSIEMTEKANKQTFDKACYAARYWRVVEKCDFVRAK